MRHLSPTRHGAGEPVSAAGSICLRLEYRAPMSAQSLLGFLGTRAIAGVESYAGGSYRRSLRLPHSWGVADLADAEGHFRCQLFLGDLRDISPAVQRCRRLLDLDADPVAVDEHLGTDELLGPLVGSEPGQRVPGSVDGFELAVRAILGQRVSVAGARTSAGRVVARYGERLSMPAGGISHLFPTAEALSEAELDDVPLPNARRAVRALASKVASGDIDLGHGADREETRRRLLELHGVGPWTAAYVAMRALGDPDVFLGGDLGIKRAFERLGRALTPKEMAALAERWSPWRSYATLYLWNSLATSNSGAAAETRQVKSRRLKNATAINRNTRA
ncbi:MAG: DNA-3-methyladenine glycosylase 2 family protein [Actinobacteria bacterium]|nr:DNA-3-methyladenine glycosylase 2 family protein [Actinomycetota bacterium]